MVNTGVGWSAVFTARRLKGSHQAMDRHTSTFHQILKFLKGLL